jgi:mycofactocin system FadH/OYE family oxidoreductase 2
MTFRTLHSPITIGSQTIKNRIAFLAHRTNLAGKGRVSDALMAYYRERARGGAGLIIVGELTVHPNDRPYEKMIELYADGVHDGLRRLVYAGRAEGALVFGQLKHRGFQSQGAISRQALWGPGPLSDVVHGELCKAMEPEDIDELTASFARGAERLLDAGFEGLEVDIGEDSLLRQFLSPLTNHRTDDYGRDASGRLRLAIEVLQSVRKVAGGRVLVGVRLCLDEIFWGSVTLEDSLQAARELERLGLADFFNTTVGTFYNLHLVQASMHNPEGLTLEKAAALKAAIQAPVFGGNRIHTPEFAERALEQGQVDVIGWIRPLICDPDLPKKSLLGELHEAVFCVSDNQNCVGRTSRIKPIGCIQNPWAGRELERPHSAAREAAKRKTVLVAGAGPGGLQAALTAALQGHHVTVYEKANEPGGQIRLARLGAGRAPIWGVVENLVRRLKRLDVPILTNRLMDAESILAEGPDAVVLAIGSYPDPKPVAGNYGPPAVLNVWQALEMSYPVGKRVLLIDENGGHQATAAAEFLADQGRKVDIMTSEPFVGWELAATGDLYLTRQRLLQKGGRFFADRIALEIQSNVVIACDKFTEETFSIEGYETIVLAMGNIPNDELYKDIKGRLPIVRRVGDCVAPRKIDMAILEGGKAALSL